MHLNQKTKILTSIIISFFVLNVSSFAQIDWIKDPDNPVLRRDTVYANLPNDLIVISDGWVIKEGLQYKMWYTCGGINYPADTLLRSRICYCESADGVHWTKYSGNPVLDVSYTNEWDSSGVETVSVIIDDNAPLSQRYKMWYAGQTVNSYRYDIGYAYSPDGLNWTKHPIPVLQVGASGEWDNGFLEGPSVIFDEGIYKMWYCGYDAFVDANGTDGHANIGYATSPDGINWTKYEGNPVLTTGIDAWDSVLAQDPHVIKENDLYHMWYGGNDVGTYGQKVGYAWSVDGINWTKSNANPVLSNGAQGEWDANTASFPSVINDNGVYKMWYTGKDVDPIPNGLDYYWEIGYATAIVSSLEELINDADMSVYPNPFHLSTTLKISEALDDGTWTIYNSIGQPLVSKDHLFGNSVVIDRNDLTAGVYVLHLYQNHKISYSKIIVISE